MLFDTDVLIWVFRGSESAARVVERAEQRHVSVVTYMELLQGARDRAEVRNIKDFLVDLSFQMAPLDENIGHRASIYMEEYALKAGLRLADALIAATAVEHHLPLCTGNRKHYRSIGELEIKVFRG
jgi:predicted nucleic acid-binding protein